MITALDTNILLDVAASDPVYAGSSERALIEVLDLGALVIRGVSYAELALQYDLRESFDAALKELDVRIAESGADIAWLARRWKDCNDAGGTCQGMLADF